MSTLKFERQAEYIGHYDTVVCGGGPAGWVTAVSSARAGKKTALIERFGFLGGTASAGLVVPLSGCFYSGQRVVGGITWEFVEKMVADGAAQVELPKGHISFDPEYYKLVALRMVRDAGVDVYTNSYITDCVKVGKRVTHVIFDSKNGAEAISANVFVDATGDGDLCHLAGVEMLEIEGEMQPMSMCFLLGGVDLTTDLLKNCIHHDGKACKQSVNMVIHDRLEELAKTEEVPQFGGPWFNTVMCGDLVTVNITRAAGDATNRDEMLAAEEKMREDAFKLVNILRREYPEFKNAYIPLTAIQAGVRETRHIKGVHTVTGEEIMSGTDFEDSVGLCAHPMDIHVSRDNSQILKHLTGAGKIPYRSMISEQFDNLYAVGRCMSADRFANASIRVQATLMALGEAIGIAASMCDENTSVHDVDIKALHAKLDERNAIY